MVPAVTLFALMMLQTPGGGGGGGEGAPAQPAGQPAPAATQPAPAAQPAAAEPTEPRKDANPEVVLIMRDGTVFQGILLSKSDKEYVVDIAGVPATFKAEKVERLRELRPVLERYKELRDAAPQGDVEQRASLIRWLADRRQLDLAVTEAELLALKNPKSITAEKLYQELKLRADLVVKGPKPAPAAQAPADDQRINPTDFPFLTDAQVSLIKVYEIDLSKSPRVIFPRDAASRMMEEYAGSPLVPASREARDALLRQDPLELVQLMFRLRARSYYDKVRVLDQPESMRRFRDDVHRVTLMTGCATSQCHGGRDAGRFVLSTFRPTTDTTVYTNYYIVNNYRTVNDQPLIDWEKPDQSLLYQYALPREIARFRHPPVTKDGKDMWKPAFTSADDVRAKAMSEWIKSAYKPRPDYSLDYVPFRSLTRQAIESAKPSPVYDPVLR